MSENIKRKGRTETGIVVKAGKSAKTITVEAKRFIKHPKYQKFIKSRKKFLVHDEHGKATRGDFVRIIESRPISKMKRWRLLEIIEGQKIDLEPIPVEPGLDDASSKGGEA